MLLYLFARCSFLFEALLGKGMGEVEGEGEGGRGRGGGKGKGREEGEVGSKFCGYMALSWLIPDNCHVK